MNCKFKIHLFVLNFPLLCAVVKCGLLFWGKNINFKWSQNIGPRHYKFIEIKVLKYLDIVYNILDIVYRWTSKLVFSLLVTESTSLALVQQIQYL